MMHKEKLVFHILEIRLFTNFKQNFKNDSLKQKGLTFQKSSTRRTDYVIDLQHTGVTTINYKGHVLNSM